MATSIPSAGAGGNRSGSYQRRNVDPFAAIRRNHRIKVPAVRCISPEGRQLGILDTQKAISLALEVGLDLVEVAPDYDHSQSTSILAAQILLNFLGFIFHAKGAR